MQMYLLMNLPERVLVRSDTVSCLALFSAKVQVQTCQGPDSQSQGYWGLPGSCWLRAQRRANRGSWKPHLSIQWQKLQAMAGEGLGHGPLGSPLPRRSGGAWGACLPSAPTRPLHPHFWLRVEGWRTIAAHATRYSVLSIAAHSFPHSDFGRVFHLRICILVVCFAQNFGKTGTKWILYF